MDDGGIEDSESAVKKRKTSDLEALEDEISERARETRTKKIPDGDDDNETLISEETANEIEKSQAVTDGTLRDFAAESKEMCKKMLNETLPRNAPKRKRGSTEKSEVSEPQAMR